MFSDPFVLVLEDAVELAIFVLLSELALTLVSIRELTGIGVLPHVPMAALRGSHVPVSVRAVLIEALVDGT